MDILWCIDWSKYIKTLSNDNLLFLKMFTVVCTMIGQKVSISWKCPLLWHDESETWVQCHIGVSKCISQKEILIDIFLLKFLLTSYFWICLHFESNFKHLEMCCKIKTELKLCFQGICKHWKMCTVGLPRTYFLNFNVTKTYSIIQSYFIRFFKIIRYEWYL